MTTYKIKYKSYIADLVLPEGGVRSVTVVLPGLPKSSDQKLLVKALLNAGSAVLYPDYSGSFNSGGIFSAEQCVKDVREFIAMANKSEFKELYFNKKIELGNCKVNIVGVSFGAIILILANLSNVDKIMFLSPAFLFNQKDIDQIVKFDFKLKMSALSNFLKRAFKFTYRVESFEQLRKFLNGGKDTMRIKRILKKLEELDCDSFIIHGKLDTTVPYEITSHLKEKVSNPRIKWLFPDVSHSVSSYDENTLKTISDFISN